MKTKLSHSALNVYNTCGRKYDLHYNKRLRSKVISGALIIGSAIDKGLNELLISKDLEKAIKVFDSEFEYGWINNKKVHLPESELIVYAKKDFDEELLTEIDEEIFNKKSNEDELNIKNSYDILLNRKETVGFENLDLNEKKLYNLANWLCLKRKAHLMLKAYSEKVIPKIKNVIAIQKEFNLEGKTGIIPGFIDLIAEMNDGKTYILDNKTSSMEYESDSASKSQQLILYKYAGQKEGIKLDGAGFIVMYKNIQKNRIKICEKCGHNGTGGRHKTCDNNTVYHGENETDKTRCNGTWKEIIKPECKIDIILNEIPIEAQNLVIQTFQGAVDGIEKKHFGPNLDSCMKFNQPCVYYKKCWQGKDEDLITLESKDEKK